MHYCWNGNVVIKMNFLHRKLTTSFTASDEKFVKMTKFSLQCIGNQCMWPMYWNVNKNKINNHGHCMISMALCKRDITQLLMHWSYTFFALSHPNDHYTDVIMTAMVSQIISLKVVYSTVYSDTDQRNHQSSASLAFVRGIHRDRWIPHTKGQLREKCFHLMTTSYMTDKCTYSSQLPVIWLFHKGAKHIAGVRQVRQ